MALYKQQWFHLCLDLIVAADTEECPKEVQTNVKPAIVQNKLN